MFQNLLPSKGGPYKKAQITPKSDHKKPTFLFLSLQTLILLIGKCKTVNTEFSNYFISTSIEKDICI